MRTRTGKLIADLNDKEGAITSASLPDTTEMNFVDENQTSYLLFPYELNDPPIFTKNIFDGSTPIIQSELSYSPAKTGTMYHDEEGVVKVLINTSFVFRVEAQQPNTLNVENGVPIVFQKDANIIYQWFKDGERIPRVIESEFQTQADYINTEIEEASERLDRVQGVENELVFTNVSQRMSGRYTCVVSNDIGDITSEAIELQVLHPYDFENVSFKTNLIQNGFAENDLDGWTVTLGGATTKGFLPLELEREAKRPHTGLFGHSPNEIYPHPANIRTNAIKTYQPNKLLEPTAKYFTRDAIKYALNGGTSQAIIYQDVDLTGITDYISGKVYGCNGVRAYFGCIIGNALTKYIPVVDMIGPNLKNKPDLYYSGAPRISYENFVLGGPGFLDESVSIILQEYEGETALPSVQYKNNETVTVPFIELKDTLHSLLQQSDLFNEPINPPTTNTIRTADGFLYTPQPIQSRIVNMYKSLYPNKEEYYSYGQYADYQDAIIRVLNPRTTKVKISLRFEYHGWGVYGESLPAAEEVLQMHPWDKPYFKLLYRPYTKDIWTTVASSQNPDFATKPFPQVVSTITPRAMATGLGLILEPLTAASYGIANFKNDIIQIPSKQEEQRPRPVNIFPKSPISFEKAAENMSGLSAILDFNAGVYFRFFRRYDSVRDDPSWSSAAYSFVDGGEDKDDEYMNGRMVIENITTGETLVSKWFHATEQVKYGEDATAYGYSEKTLGGLQIIRITVTADGTSSGENGNKDLRRDSAYPFLHLVMNNTKALLEADGQTYDINAFPNDALSTTPQPITTFISGGSSGKFPRDPYRARKISIEVPSNCLLGIIGGVRNHNNSPDTEDRTITARMFFDENDNLMYHVTN